MNRRGLLLVLVLAALQTAQVAPPAVAPPVEAPPAEAPADHGTETQPLLRRDPFRPFMLDARPQARVLLTPLQRFQLGQLTVVGTIWEASPPRALLQDSVGMGYIVTLGTPVGPNGGTVAAIEPDHIVVEEHVSDFYGKQQVKRIVLEIPKEEGPNQPARE